MRTFFLLYVVPYEVLCKSDGAMYLPVGKSDAPTARCCLRSDVACGAMCAFGTICAKALATLKSPDKSQGNAIIHSIIADYFVPKILSPASPRPGTM